MRKLMISFVLVFSNVMGAMAQKVSVEKGKILPADTTYMKSDSVFSIVRTVHQMRVQLQVNSNYEVHAISNRPLNRVLVKKNTGTIIREIRFLKPITNYKLQLKGMAKGEVQLAFYATNGQEQTFTVRVDK